MDGACGRVEGRGILFDREAPCETKLQSFAVRESKLAADRGELKIFVLIGRTEWMLAPGRLEKVAHRAGHRVSEINRRKGGDIESKMYTGEVKY